MNPTKEYRFWDIPNTMLLAVSNIVKEDERAIIWITEGDAIREQVLKIIKGSRVQVIFLHEEDLKK